MRPTTQEECQKHYGMSLEEYDKNFPRCNDWRGWLQNAIDWWKSDDEQKINHWKTALPTQLQRIALSQLNHTYRRFELCIAEAELKASKLDRLLKAIKEVQKTDIQPYDPTVEECIKRSEAVKELQEAIKDAEGVQV